MRESPKAKIRVYHTTFLSSLNIVPTYEGKRNVIQHGANKANTPARNDAVRDIPNIKLESILIYNRFNFKDEF